MTTAKQPLPHGYESTRTRAEHEGFGLASLMLERVKCVPPYGRDWPWNRISDRKPESDDAFQCAAQF